jgi:diguanylate cyclase (GGDEF)-like protein
VISLKKYLDMDPSKPSSPKPDLSGLSSVILESYRAALLAMGKSGARAFPTAGSDLQQSMASLEKRLAANLTASLVKETEAEVEEQLQQWGGCTAEYFKTKTNEVKELLIVLARTAESMGERDHRYANHFSEFRAQLQTIADLEDLAQVRSTLVQQANELKTYVDQMAQDSRESVAQLQAEVTTYETKLKAVEQLASQDSLTGLANRRKVEERIEWRIAHEQVFCVVILDLDRFKQVNDTYGHPAGDNLLQQFSQELRANSRSTDIVGRWGGDEFIVVLDCDLETAKSQIERVEKWVLGEYTIQSTAGVKEAKLEVAASIGVAQWTAGQTMPQLIASADSAMYREKALTKSQKAGR